MKKYFYILIMILSIFFIKDINATELDSKFLCAIDLYKNSSYYETYPYCFIYKGNNFFGCSQYDSPQGFYKGSNDFLAKNPSKYLKFFYFYDSNTDTCSINTGATTYTSSWSTQIYTNYFYSFDLYDTGNNLFQVADFTFSNNNTPQPTLYTITFVPPSNTIIEVKDNNNNVIQASSQYVYELEAGNYTYSATNSMYNTLTNVPFTVSEDISININMTSKLENSNMRSIFSQYYTYISALVSDIFNIDNPLFLFIISFIIGFSLILLIKKMLGGFI